MASTRQIATRHLRKKLRPGHVVTWGNGRSSYPILEVRSDGVLVDMTADPASHQYCTERDGRWTYFVPFHKRGDNRVRLASEGT